MSDHVTTLTTDLLVHELKGIEEWVRLGLYLGLSMAEIKEIEHTHPDTSSRRMAMLDKWMRKEGNPSWEMVVEALEKMSELGLANQLREKYCQEHIICSQQVAHVQPGLNTMTQPGPERVIVLDRRGAIGQKLENFCDKYLDLVIATEHALEDANLSPKQIKRFSLFHMQVEVDTVYELVDQMQPLHFLDYAILEKMISSFLKHDHSVVNELSNYIEQLEQFKSSTFVKHFMESIETAQQPLTTSEIPRTCTVTLKLVGGWLPGTVADLDKLLKVLFQDKSYVLRHLRILLSNGGEESDFSSESPLMKTLAGNPMFTSNMYMRLCSNLEDSVEETCSRDLA